MDFQTLLHDELSSLFPTERERREAEFLGLLRGSVIERRGKEILLCLSHRSLALLKKCLVLKKEFLPLEHHELILSREQGINAGLFYRLIIHVPQDFLVASGFYTTSPLEKYLRGMVASDFIRGVFELRGYVANPLRSYHLEMRFASEDLARLLQKTLQKAMIPFRCRQVKSEWHLYTKSAATIASFLGYLGAQQSYLELERIRVEKETVDQLTRWVNYTTSNLERTVRSSLRQREKIRNLPLEILPPKLREIAILRLRYPYASFRELGMYCSPPLSKGEVYRRLKALEKEAERFWQRLQNA
ncbi:MAG: DNA-binding protein WhiA [Atribacterota bacterium]